MAKTASTPINPGSNVIPVVSPAQVPAGTYWILAEYSGDPQICVDTATGNKVDYISVTYGALPDPFITPRSNAAATSTISLSVSRELRFEAAALRIGPAMFAGDGKARC
jgi:hypothetical protein